MSTSRAYLRPDVAVECLYNDWYAWPYLLSPATGAMCVANAQLKIMQSFVQTPSMHIAALKNPKMRGGPFVEYDETRAPEVAKLVERTAGLRHILDFAEAVKTLDRLLAEEATGFSLESFYAKVPELLRGYCELVYDHNNQPSIRFVEGLLYQSPYYDTSLHSVVLSRVGQGEPRPFAFSSPRLARPGDVRLDLPFSSKALDALYRARYEAVSVSSLADALGVAPGQREAFAELFTDVGPRASAFYHGDDVRIRYFGHACVLIEAKGVSILVDPVISHDFDCGVERFTHADLPPVIDYVLLTHNHQDHVIIEPMLELRHRVKTVIVPRSAGGTLVDPSLKRILENIGFERVVELAEMDAIPVEGGEILALPFLGEHGDLDIRTKLTYRLGLRGRTILFMADSNVVEPRMNELVHRAIGDVDVLFLGMECEGAPISWLYGSLFTKPLVRKMDQSRRLDGSNYLRAADVVQRFNPSQVYVYAMGQEPWLAHLMSLPFADECPQVIESNKLMEACHAQGIVAERPYCQLECVLEAREQAPQGVRSAA